MQDTAETLLIVPGILSLLMVIFKGWKKFMGSLGEHDVSRIPLSELIISILSARLHLMVFDMENKLLYINIDGFSYSYLKYSGVNFRMDVLEIDTERQASHQFAVPCVHHQPDAKCDFMRSPGNQTHNFYQH